MKDISRLKKILTLFAVIPLFILAWAVVSIIVYLLFVNVFKQEAYISGIIGATGSLMGGLFTLVGVKWTLEKQKNDRFLDVYSERISSLIEIRKLLSDIYTCFSKLATADYAKNNEYSEIENLIYDKKSKVCILGAKVDGEIFDRALVLDEEIKTASEEIHHHKRTGNFQAVFDEADRIKVKVDAFSVFAEQHIEKLRKLHKLILKKSDISVHNSE